MTQYFLYAVSCPSLDGGIIKIGIADNVEKRVRSLQTGCPYPIKVMALWRYDEAWHARHAEKACHDRFKKLNTHGEWFRVNLVSIIWFLREYNDGKKLGGGEEVSIPDVRIQRKAADRLVKATPRIAKKPRKIERRVKSISRDIATQILSHRRHRTA